jgi:hypothetical protein
MTAFERHLEASASKRGEEDPTVIAAYDDLADAFATYDDALLQAYGEMTPLDIYDGDDDEDDDEEDDGDDDEDDDEDEGDEELDDHGDEDGDGSVYSGLDDADYEVERER